MYAWFRDRMAANQFVQFVETLQARRHLRPDIIDHLAATHALALGGTIVLHPRQRADGGYAVPIGTGRLAVERLPGRPWWRTLLWHVEVVAVGFVVWWVLGFVLGWVEVARW